MALKEFGFHFDTGFSYPELALDGSIPYPQSLLYNSALRVLLYKARSGGEQLDLSHGLEFAGLLIAISLRCQHLPIALQTLLLRSQMQMVLGNTQAGLADVLRALEFAEPERFISVFLEEGAPIAEALKTLLKGNSLRVANYVQEILAAFPKVPRDKQSVLPGHTARNAASVDESLVLIEPLTARELEVLQHIAAGDSNQKIAEKLVITLSAVKKHTGNIFRKLNVSSRTQAIVRARQLGLLSSE
jgi:LuxR family maltose regulon positive regulatory protein